MNTTFFTLFQFRMQVRERRPKWSSLETRYAIRSAASRASRPPEQNSSTAAYEYASSRRGCTMASQSILNTSTNSGLARHRQPRLVAPVRPRLRAVVHLHAIVRFVESHTRRGEQHASGMTDRHPATSDDGCRFCTPLVAAPLLVLPVRRPKGPGQPVGNSRCNSDRGASPLPSPRKDHRCFVSSPSSCGSGMHRIHRAGLLLPGPVKWQQTILVKENAQPKRPAGTVSGVSGHGVAYFMGTWHSPCQRAEPEPEAANGPRIVRQGNAIDGYEGEAWATASWRKWIKRGPRKSVAGCLLWVTVASSSLAEASYVTCIPAGTLSVGFSRRRCGEGRAINEPVRTSTIASENLVRRDY